MFGILEHDNHTAISAYVLAMAVSFSACGWVADRFGSRKVFASAILLFTTSSVFRGLTNTLANVMQQLAASCAVPLAAAPLDIRQLIFSDPNLIGTDFSLPFPITQITDCGITQETVLAVFRTSL